jgi:hypothetical protein
VVTRTAVAIYVQVLIDAGAKVNTAVAATPEYLDFIAEVSANRLSVIGMCSVHSCSVTGITIALLFLRADTLHRRLRYRMLCERHVMDVRVFLYYDCISLGVGLSCAAIVLL